MAEKCFKGMSGAHAAMFTPFDAKGRVNPEMIAKIMDYGYANCLKGFYLTGTTGEWWLLSLEERKQVLAAAVASNKGRGKLIAHVGANRTDDSVELARYAAEIGIDWVSSIAPQLYRTSFDATLYHYRKIAEATDLPFMVYSMGAALVPERDIRFFDLKNVKGIKYTGRDYYAAQRLKRARQEQGDNLVRRLRNSFAVGSPSAMFRGRYRYLHNIIPKHIAMICEYAANDFGRRQSGRTKQSLN